MASPENAQLITLTVDRRSLECPVCYEVPLGEINNCEAGHSLCNSCSGLLGSCPLCQRSMTSSRNFTLESLIAEFHKVNEPKINCTNTQEGCQFRGRAVQLKEHQKNCEYSMVGCNQRKPKCGAIGVKLSKYLDHLIRVHKIDGETAESSVVGVCRRSYGVSEGFDLSTSNLSWSPFFLKFDGHAFLGYACARNGKCYFWIKLIGPDHLCRKYSANISIQSEHTQPSYRFKWKVPVHPLRALDSVIQADPKNLAVLSSAKIHRCEYYEDYYGVQIHKWNYQITVTRNY